MGGERDAHQDGKWAEVDREAVLGMFMTMPVCVAERVLSTEMTAMSKHKSFPVVNWRLLFQFPQLGPPPTLASRHCVHLHSTDKQTVEEWRGSSLAQALGLHSL